MSATIPTADAIEAQLRQSLRPAVLEVIDESAAHAGHSGANGLGYGTHFRVRIGGPAFAISPLRAFTRWPSRSRTETPGNSSTPAPRNRPTRGRIRPLSIPL